MELHKRMQSNSICDDIKEISHRRSKLSLRSSRKRRREKIELEQRKRKEQIGVVDLDSREYCERTNEINQQSQSLSQSSLQLQLKSQLRQNEKQRSIYRDAITLPTFSLENTDYRNNVKEKTCLEEGEKFCHDDDTSQKENIVQENLNDEDNDLCSDELDKKWNDNSIVNTRKYIDKHQVAGFSHKDRENIVKNQVESHKISQKAKESDDNKIALESKLSNENEEKPDIEERTFGSSLLKADENMKKESTISGTIDNGENHETNEGKLELFSNIKNQDMNKKDDNNKIIYKDTKDGTISIHTHITIEKKNNNTTKKVENNTNEGENGQRISTPTKILQHTKNWDDFTGLSAISPNLNDFDISNAQLLADADKTLDRNHTYLLGQSKLVLTKSKLGTKTPRTGTKKRQYSLKPTSNVKEPCVLCSTCSCSRSNAALQSLQETAIDEDKNPLSCRARTNTEIERALISRLGRLEKSASYFNHLCQKVSKELKRHRNKIVKARIKRSSEGDTYSEGKKAWFLHDVHEDTIFHEKSLHSSAKLSDKMVRKAAKKAYAFRRKSQPTLTQMLGDDNLNNEEMNGQNENNQILNLDDIEIYPETNNESECQNSMADMSLKAITLDVSDELSQSSSDSDHRNKNSDSQFFVDYEIASSRGKERGLWELSNAKRNNFFQSKHLSCENLMPLEEEDFKNHDLYIEYYRDEILSLLTVNENDGMDVLIDLFQDTFHRENLKDKHNASNSNNGEFNQATLSQLSQGHKETFREMKSNALNDLNKMKSIQSVCPNWEENLIFTLQQCPEDIQDALNNVRRKQARIKRAEEIILERKEQINSVMEFFESILLKSLDMHDTKTSNNREENSLD